ncbi:MAG: RNA methyltransferase [Pseudomonadota bacterium]
MSTQNHLPFIENIHVVLSHPTHPGNVGASARAMKTMGLHHLRLINPKDFPSSEASRRASRATDILEDAAIFTTFEDSLSDMQFIAGTSARSRSLAIPVVSPQVLAERIVLEAKAGRQCALLFGTENSGLSNDELHACHCHVNIPTNPDYSSLNLASAVQLISYELSKQLLLEKASLFSENTQKSQKNEEEHATSEEMHNFFNHLQDTIIDIGFLNPENPRHLMTRLKRLYNRARPTKVELNILRGILAMTQKKHPVKDALKPDDVSVKKED